MSETPSILDTADVWRDHYIETAENKSDLKLMETSTHGTTLLRFYGPSQSEQATADLSAIRQERARRQALIEGAGR